MEIPKKKLKIELLPLGYCQRKQNQYPEEINAPPCSLEHYLQYTRYNMEIT